jgi:hypothetical protein
MDDLDSKANSQPPDRCETHSIPRRLALMADT